MSLFALVLVGVEISIHGMRPERDEGALAHLYQLLVVGQVPIISFFVFRCCVERRSKGCGWS